MRLKRRILVGMSIRRSALLLSCLAIGLYAQAPKSARVAVPPPGVVHAVLIEGNKIYSTPELVKVAGLKTGQTASPSAFKSAQEKLLATDLFSSVKYEFRWTGSKPAEYYVTYTVSEYGQLAPLRFEGLGVPEASLKQYLRSHVELYNDSIPATDSVVRRYSSAAQDFISQTKPDLKVKAFVLTDDPQQPIVMIRPDTPLPRIAGITITGNKAVETATLQRAVNDVAVGQRLSDANIHQILNATAKSIYMEKGYAAVSFPKIETEKAKQNSGYIVHVQVQEGPVFHFGTSAFRGGNFTPDDIRGLMHYSKGETFDGSKAEQLRAALVKTLRKQGHLDAKIDLARQQDDKDRAVNLVYAIAAGPVYTFQTLEVHGLDIESEPQIRKLWAPKPGKPFNPDYPDFFLNKVRDMSLFDNLGTTRSTFQADDATHAVTVKLYFKGAAAESEKKKQLSGTPGIQEPPAEPVPPAEPPPF
jgi:outer membrane protein insertion porin family